MTLYFPLPPELLTVKSTAAVHDEALGVAEAETVQLLVIAPVVKVVDTKLPPQPDAVSPV